MNGIRECAWLCLTSGHLNVETMRFTRTRAMANGKATNINIFELKVTPSMKDVVYSVYVVFSSDSVYVPNLSKCDCPNGWLLCTHKLATFLLIRLVQMKNDFVMQDLISLMPVPIKSLQSVPMAALYVFGELSVSNTRKGQKNQGVMAVVAMTRS